MFDTRIVLKEEKTLCETSNVHKEKPFMQKLVLKSKSEKLKITIVKFRKVVSFALSYYKVCPGNKKKDQNWSFAIISKTVKIFDPAKRCFTGSNN